MVELNGAAKIACEKCRHTFYVDSADLDIDQTWADERRMGAEIFYGGEIELSCPKCRNLIQLTYEASEY